MNNFPKSPTQFPHPKNRASVLVLVVATLGLLVVIGTVYVLTSRLERNNATSMSTAVNLDLARGAIMSQAQQVIGSAMLDNNNKVGGYGLVGGGQPQAARNYDYPEYGSPFGQSVGNLNVRDEPWLVAHLHTQFAPGAPVAGINDMTVLTVQPYDPLTGNYSGGLVLNTFPPPTALGAAATATVVGDQTQEVTPTPDDPPTVNADAYINLLPFSDASSVRYRFGLRILDTNRMANLNTGATDDVAAKADTNGTNLTSLRLAPANGWPPINSYFVSTPTTDVAPNLHTTPGLSGLGRAGTSGMAFGLASWQNVLLTLEKPAITNLAPFELSDELELRSYGEFGTSYHGRFALGNGVNHTLWPYTLSASPLTPNGGTAAGNPPRRNYTTYSFSRQPRPYPDPVGVNNTPFTLTYIAGTYSNAAPFQAPSDFLLDFGSASQLIPPHSPDVGWSANVWTTAPYSTFTAGIPSTLMPRIAIDPPLAVDTASLNQTVTNPSQQNWTSMYHLAMAATNIGTAMERCSSYTHREACEFAANYITSLWSGIILDPNIPTATASTYFWPSGPSFVDDQGICVRTAFNNGKLPYLDTSINQIGANFGTNPATATDLASGGNTYLGFAAQPYINKIAIQSTSDGAGNGAASVTVGDSVIELFNPYSVALSMRGYFLVDAINGLNLDLTQDENNQNLYVPPGGFLIITSGAGAPVLAPVPSAGPPATVVGKYPTKFNLATAGGTFVLRRLFIDRSFANKLATVDRASYAAVDAPNSMFAASATAGTLSQFVARSDFSNATLISVPAGVVFAPPALRTLGRTAGSPTYNLYDRATSVAGSPTPIANISDFNRIMRIGNFIDVSGNPVAPTATVPNGLLTERLAGLGITPPDVSPDTPAQCTNEAKEAIIHFDFWVNPQVFANTSIYPIAISPPTTPVPVDPAHKCDMRAFVLLDCLAPLDRYSNYSINIGGGNPDITKLRIPGQINVNTASGDVLRALPAIDVAPSPSQVVANILAYRNRKVGNVADPMASYNGVAANKDYSVTATYPGLGIHSLGELQVPIFDATGGTPASIDARDKLWASVYNLCTVRSDTFAVYGYLEAVKQNPRFSAVFNNAGMWYGTGIANITDDPHDPSITTIPLLRVARRRWIAIVDRSFSNYARANPSFSLPRVVAIKDLPQ